MITEILPLVMLEALPLDGQRLDIEEGTHRLVALIDGLSVQAVLYPARVPPGRQVALLDQLLGSFAKTPPVRGGTGPAPSVVG